MKLGPRLLDTKTINIIKNPRQLRQFDPLSHADQNECFQQNVIQRQINSDYRSHKDS
jgi:hypothetical protein